ncbi:MAG: hypothetical protein AABZ39_02130 [Spirochaetota bacterium]
MRYVIILSLAALALCGETNINVLFSYKSGAVAYYNSQRVNASEYARAAALRDSIAKSARVRAVFIADVLPEAGNEIVALKNDGREGFSIHATNGSTVFSYTPSGTTAVSSAMELSGHRDATNEFRVLKYYVLTEKPDRRHADCHLFRIDTDGISLITVVQFYDEIRTKRGVYTTTMESIFVDITKDGYLDLLIAQVEQGVTKSRAEYQLYSYCPKEKVYAFTLSDLGQEDAVSYAAYFARK